MGASSIYHWIVLLLVVLVVFGAGKIPTIMGDIGKGIKNFKKNITEDNNDKNEL